MPKVLLQISYDIDPEKREQYLALVREMKAHFSQARKKSYAVYEQKGKKNSFVLPDKRVVLKVANLPVTLSLIPTLLV